MNTVAVIVAVIGIASAFFVFGANIYLVLENRRRKRELMLFYIRFHFDIVYGATYFLYSFFILGFTIFENEFFLANEYLFPMGLPFSNATAGRTVLVLFIVLDRVLASYLPIPYRVLRPRISNAFLLLLTLTFVGVEDAVILLICEQNSHQLNKTCIAFPCTLNPCAYSWWTSYKSVAFPIIIVLSAALCIRLLVFSKKVKKSTVSTRANRLALLDAFIVFLFDFLPAFCANQFPLMIFSAYTNLGPLTSMLKLVGRAFESIIVIRIILRTTELIKLRTKFLGADVIKLHPLRETTITNNFSSSGASELLLIFFFANTSSSFQNSTSLILQMHITAVVVTAIGIVSAFFVLGANVFLVLEKRRKKRELMLFYIRFHVDIVYGATYFLYSFFILGFTIYGNEFFLANEYLFPLGLPFSNASAGRTVLVLFIVVDRVWASYLPIPYRVLRPRISNAFLLLLALTFAGIEDAVILLICEQNSHQVNNTCFAFPCTLNPCAYSWWTSYKSFAFPIIIVLSAALCIRLLVFSKKVKKSTMSTRANRLALLDAFIVFLFDFLPAFCANQFPRATFVVYAELGSLTGILKQVGRAIESMIVIRILVRTVETKRLRTVVNV